jgi:D-proline reductase (dithiol) PrdB
MSDAQMRAAFDGVPVPVFETTAFTLPPPLREATVALVTTAGLRRPDQPDWAYRAGDQSFRVLEVPRGSDPELMLSHSSHNFDRSGFVADLNVVLPLDRLRELAAAGAIKAVAPRHVSFIGNLDETLATIRLDTGPAAARVLREAGANVVLLTPV